MFIHDINHTFSDEIDPDGVQESLDCADARPFNRISLIPSKRLHSATIKPQRVVETRAPKQIVRSATFECVRARVRVAPLECSFVCVVAWKSVVYCRGCTQIHANTARNPCEKGGASVFVWRRRRACAIATEKPSFFLFLSLSPSLTLVWWSATHWRSTKMAVLKIFHGPPINAIVTEAGSCSSSVSGRWAASCE